MIKTERGYRRAMKRMIKRVRSTDDIAELDSSKMDPLDAEILYDCIAEGYIRGKLTDTLGRDKHKIELRAMSGKALPEVYNNIITLKGLAFLKPDRTRLKANIALAISICAMLISLMANLDKVLLNLQLLKGLAG